MAEKTTETKTAKPTGISLYVQQLQWLKLEASRLTRETGRPVSTSKVMQMMIDEKRKAGK